MTLEQAFIISELTRHLKEHPDKTVSKALYDLDINQMYVGKFPGSSDSLLRDIYNDNDEEIVNRIKRSI